MSPAVPQDTDPARGEAAHHEAAQRKRLAEVFGDVLPDTTSDERDPEAGDAQGVNRDDWFREQVPPHHG